MVIRHGSRGRLPRLQYASRSAAARARCPPASSARRTAARSPSGARKKRGKAFYGCSNYPNCDFVCWDKPVPEACPECGYVGAESKRTKARGEYRRCLKCGNEWDVVSQEAEAVAV